MKRNKGITLVALVVTIIVLIILAGVSISLVLGDNGIITKAKLGKQEMANAQELEERTMQEFENEIHVASSSRGYSTETELWSGNMAAEGEIQLSDSYTNYKAIAFLYGESVNETVGQTVSSQYTKSNLEFIKAGNGRIALYGYGNYLINLELMEDTTKMKAVAFSTYRLYKIIGLK